MPEYIYFLVMDGKPQMPTTRRIHVQKLLDTGKARIAEHVPFTIQLLYDNDPVLQPVTLAEDPGRTNIGLAVLDLKGNLLLSAVVETRNKEIAKLIEKRRQCRRASRNGERKARQRLAKKYGTMIKAGMEMRKLPLYKADKFMQLEDPSVSGVDFQNGPLNGYDDRDAAVYDLQDGKCLMCKHEITQYHHIVPRSRNGSNTLEKTSQGYVLPVMTGYIRM